MNIRELNERMLKDYNAAGITADGIIVDLFDTGCPPLGPLKGRVKAGTPDGLTATADHGRSVASILAQVPGLEVCSYRVLPNGVNDPTGPIIDWLEKLLPIVKADTTHQHIVNMSLSGLGNLADPEIKRMQAAIDALVAYNVPVVVAAGNDGHETPNLYPGGFESPITAAALTEDARHADFSTLHNEVDFAELGAGVMVLNPTTLGYHTSVSGTSFACPIVVCKIALLMAAYKKHIGKWPTEPWVYTQLKLMTLDLGDGGRDPLYGWGWVDIKTPAAVELPGKEEPIVTRRTLRKGMTGDDVRELQTLLLKHGFDPQGTDGDFGTKTEAAVKAFQEALGLTVDGIVGPKTWAALDASTVAPAPPSAPGSTGRDKLVAAVLANAAALLGTSYSQDYRNNIWPGGKMDCSSYTAAIWGAAGYPLLTAAGDELRTSYREVDAAGFDLVWPASRALIGKLPSPRGLLQSYGAQAGDIVFWCFNSATTRPGKITHVGSIDVGGKNIIHIANNTDKCCRKPLDYGDGKVCAIIRLREDFALPALPDVAQTAEGTVRADEWVVRALQVALNLRRGTKLTADGIPGSKTAAAVAAVNKEIGVTGSICTTATWAALGFANNSQTTVPAPEEPRGETYIYTGANYVNIRSGPGTEYDKISKLNAGEQCTLYEVQAGWARIEKEGITGWCISNLLRKAQA